MEGTLGGKALLYQSADGLTLPWDQNGADRLQGLSRRADGLPLTDQGHARRNMHRSEQSSLDAGAQRRVAKCRSLAALSFFVGH